MSGGGTDFDYVSMDAWYYEGDETIAAADFDGGDVLAWTFIYGIDPAASFGINQWRNVVSRN